jgi:hypothetical protein
MLCAFRSWRHPKRNFQIGILKILATEELRAALAMAELAALLDAVDQRREP